MECSASEMHIYLCMLGEALKWMTSSFTDIKWWGDGSEGSLLVCMSIQLLLDKHLMLSALNDQIWSCGQKVIDFGTWHSSERDHVHMERLCYPDGSLPIRHSLVHQEWLGPPLPPIFFFFVNWVKIFFSLFYFPFYSIHIQTNTIMILSIAKTNRNSVKQFMTHQHTQPHRHIQARTHSHNHIHIQTDTYTHTHIPPPHTHIHKKCTMYHGWVSTLQTSLCEKACKSTYRSIYNTHTLSLYNSHPPQ